MTVGAGGGGGEIAGLGGAAAGSNSASYTVITGDDVERAAVERNLRDSLDRLDGVGNIEVSSGDAASSSSLAVQVQAVEEEDLREAAEQVEDAVRDTPDTTDVSSDLSEGATDVRVDVDGQAAAQRGLSETTIGQAVLTADQGLEVAEAEIYGASRDVYVQLDSEPGGVQELRGLEITTPAGETVRLDEIADVEKTEAPSQVTRVDGERGATISATATTDNTGAVSATMQQNLADLDLPDGASYSLGGVTADQGEAFTSLLIALLSAVVLVYIIMVGTFRSLIQPLALMASVPFVITGVVLALLITGTPLGISALIGMLMLVGIVVTNAIVLLDLVRQYRDRGMDTREAVIEGARHRLRPIIMTALATISALVPMAVGLTDSSGFISQPLAVVVIGGLTTSTILTLIIVPVLYTIIEDTKDRLRKRRERRRARRETKEKARLEEQGK